MTEDDGVEDADEADDVESITASHIPGGFMLQKDVGKQGECRGAPESNVVQSEDSRRYIATCLLKVEVLGPRSC